MGDGKTSREEGKNRGEKVRWIPERKMSVPITIFGYRGSKSMKPDFQLSWSCHPRENLRKTTRWKIQSREKEPCHVSGNKYRSILLNTRRLQPIKHASILLTAIGLFLVCVVKQSCTKGEKKGGQEKRRGNSGANGQRDKRSFETGFCWRTATRTSDLRQNFVQRASSR